MSDSVYERIHVALAELLETKLVEIYGENNVHVERNRDAEAQKFPSVIVIDGSIDPQPEKSGVADYITTAIVEGYVTAARSSDLGPARNALYANVLRVIKQEREALINSFGEGLVDIREGPATEIGIGRNSTQAPIAWFSLLVEIQFWTEENDPFEPGPA